MAKSNAPHVEVMPIDRLASSQANPRKHGDRNRRAIRDSLQQFGGARSIVIDGDGVIRAGNGTVDAAREIGITSVVVVDPQPGQIVAVRRKEWSDAKAAAYEIADNRSGELAEWDQATLAASLLAVQSEFDVGKLGFNEQELSTIIGAVIPPSFEIETSSPPTPDDQGDDEPDDEPEDQGPDEAKPALYPLAILLTRQQLQQWHDLKAELNERNDVKAFLRLVDIARQPSA